MNRQIAVDPNVHFGKPCIAGTRIPVQSVLELVQEGLSFEEIVRDYHPDIEKSDIQACIEYRTATQGSGRASHPGNPGQGFRWAGVR